MKPAVSIGRSVLLSPSMLPRLTILLYWVITQLTQHTSLLSLKSRMIPILVRSWKMALNSWSLVIQPLQTCSRASPSVLKAFLTVLHCVVLLVVTWGRCLPRTSSKLWTRRLLELVKSPSLRKLKEYCAKRFPPQAWAMGRRTDSELSFSPLII